MLREAAAEQNIPIMEVLADSDVAGGFVVRQSQGDRLPVQPAEEEQTTKLPSGDDIAIIVQTSGTTSRPKTVPLSHSNLVFGAGCVRETLALSSEDVSSRSPPSQPTLVRCNDNSLCTHTLMIDPLCRCASMPCQCTTCTPLRSTSSPQLVQAVL